MQGPTKHRALDRAKFKRDTLPKDGNLKPKMLFSSTIFLKSIPWSRLDQHLCSDTQQKFKSILLKYACICIPPYIHTHTHTHTHTHFYSYSEMSKRWFLKTEVCSLAFF